MSSRSNGVMNVLCRRSTQRVRDDVGLVLDLLDARGQCANVLAALHQPLHLPGALDGERGVSLEQAEEVLVAGE